MPGWLTVPWDVICMLAEPSHYQAAAKAAEAAAKAAEAKAGEAEAKAAAEKAAREVMEKGQSGSLQI